MGDIERWWLIVLPGDGQPFGVRDTERAAREYARNLSAGGTVIEVVPAEQLRGAGGALERIAAVATLAADGTEAITQLARVQTMAEAAIVSLGGR